jgi:hypothetical protein
MAVRQVSTESGTFPFVSWIVGSALLCALFMQVPSMGTKASFRLGVMLFFFSRTLAFVAATHDLGQ